MLVSHARLCNARRSYLPIAQNEDNTDEMLTSEDAARDTSAEQVCSAKAVKPCALLLGSLLVDGNLHSRDLGVQVDVGAIELA